MKSHGQTPRPPKRVPAVRRGRAEEASSVLVPQLPTYWLEPAIFDVIAVPVGTANPGNGTSAAYLLRRVRIDADTGQEVMITGITAELWPSDSAAAGAHGVTAGNALGWGDTAGLLSAIVVGRNLPLEPGVWGHMMSHVPGIEVNTTAANQHDSLRKYAAVLRLPSGKLNDTEPGRALVRYGFNPFIDRYTLGDTLDVALLTRSSQIDNGGAGPKYICGCADVRIALGLIKDQANFYE